VLYKALVDNRADERVFLGPAGGILRRSNFTRRYWRPAWDSDLHNPDRAKSVPAILTGFTFHGGRHTQRTWLADVGIADVARAARLGHKLPGMAEVYEHVTPQMKQRVLQTLQIRWETSLTELTGAELQRLLTMVPPKLSEVITRRDGDEEGAKAARTGGAEMISNISPLTDPGTRKALPSE
jgi:hypothetical protein